MVVILARLSKLAFVLMLLSVTFLSLAPVEQPDFSPNDKVNHFIAYAALTFVAAWGWLSAGGGSAWRVRLAIFIGLLGFGVLIELLQGLTGYRYPSVADVVANTVGIVIGMFVYELSYRVIKKFLKLGE